MSTRNNKWLVNEILQHIHLFHSSLLLTWQSSHRSIIDRYSPRSFLPHLLLPTFNFHLLPTCQSSPMSFRCIIFTLNIHVPPTTYFHCSHMSICRIKLTWSIHASPTTYINSSHMSICWIKLTWSIHASPTTYIHSSPLPIRCIIFTKIILVLHALYIFSMPINCIIPPYFSLYNHKVKFKTLPFLIYLLSYICLHFIYRVCAC